MTEPVRSGAFIARMFTSAVATQAVLSAANLLVSLILIRRATDSEYGYFVLIANSLLLMNALQGAYLQPPMVIRMTRTDAPGRAALIGGMAHAQRRLLVLFAAGSSLVVLIGLVAGAGSRELLLLAVALGAAMAAVFREFFRMVLLAYRRPGDVLRGDLLYVVLLVAGVFAATLTSVPAVIATLSLTVAAIAGGSLLSANLQRHEPWEMRSVPGLLRAFAPIGAWSAIGSATHWAFSQGYNYVAAGALDVTAVAALAATRLTMMPVNLLSAGIGSLMMPTASAWLNRLGPAAVFSRLLRVAAGVALAAMCYMVVLWLLRDWLFTRVMGKDFQQRDALLLAWSAVFIVAIFRDQLLYLPGASGRFRPLAFATLFSALVSLAVTWFALGRLGVVGAPLGVLVGELVNLAGLIGISVREMRSERAIGRTA